MASRIRKSPPVWRLVAFGVFVSLVGSLTSARGTSIGVVYAFKCGNVRGLTKAIASGKPAVITLNTNLVPRCTYSLTAPYGGGPDGLPVITTAVTINGNGSTIVGKCGCRVLEVDTSGTLSLANVKIRGGDAGGDGVFPVGFGGGILNSGRLTLVRGKVIDNRAYHAGGGISNSGTLTLANSSIVGNYANFGGGGLFNTGIATMIYSSIRGNRTYPIGSFGGGIDNQTPIFGTGDPVNSSVTLLGGSIIDNQAASGGGIFSNGASVVAAGVTFSGNTPNDCAGDGMRIGC